MLCNADEECEKQILRYEVSVLSAFQYVPILSLKDDKLLNLEAPGNRCFP